MNTPSPLTALAPAAPAAPSAASTSSADRAHVQELAQEFESMLLLQVMRQVRQSVLGWGEDDGEQGDVLGGDLGPLADTLNGELARYLSKAGGFGLSDLLTQPLSALANIGPDKNAAPSPALRGAGAAPLPAQLPSMDVPPVPLDRVPELSPAPLPAQPGPAAQGAPEASAGLSAPEASAALSAIAAPSGASGVDESRVLDGSDVVTSPFGWRTDPIAHIRRFHAGVDLRAAYGQNVHAAADGRVVVAREQGDYGLTVVIQHADGYQTRYAHLSSINVAEGDQVTAEQTIGLAGKSGRATGPHLHFELTRNGERVDPTSFVQPRALKETTARADSTFSGSSTRLASTE